MSLTYAEIICKLVAYKSFQQIVDINSVLFVFAKNSGKVKNIIEFVYSQNGPDRKALLSLGIMSIVLSFFLHFWSNTTKLGTLILLLTVKVGLQKTSF